MKKVFILIILSACVYSQVFAQTSSFKTYAPIDGTNSWANWNVYNKNVLPPPRPLTRAEKQMIDSQKYYNYYNQQSNGSYFYPQKSWKNKITNFFTRGQITGYTPSTSTWGNDFWNNSTNPYGYQNYMQDDKGNYYYNNYNQQTGGSIRILD